MSFSLENFCRNPGVSRVFGTYLSILNLSILKIALKICMHFSSVEIYCNGFDKYQSTKVSGEIHIALHFSLTNREQRSQISQVIECRQSCKIEI